MDVRPVCRCGEHFDCEGRKPLVLPCSHTYCLACLTAIEGSGNKLCFCCQAPWDGVAYKLPLSFKLIPGSNAATKNDGEETLPDYEICSLHSCPLEHWCCKCHVATCKKCISEQHYTHGNIDFESIFENEVPIADVRQKLKTKVGSKILLGIRAAANICDETLELIKSMEKTKQSLLTWKQHIQAHEKHTNTCIQASESESDSSVKIKMEILTKMMSQCDIEESALLKQLKMMSAKFSALGVEIELVRRKQKAEQLPILPQEFIPEASNWVIEGQGKVQRTLISLKNGTPIPNSVTLISTCSHPITSMSELLLKFGDKKCEMNLQLLDSFLHGVPPSSDSWRLEPVMKALCGVHLVSFYGHIRHSSTWAKLNTGKLAKLGLRLDSGAALTELNKILEANFGEVPSVWTFAGREVLSETKEPKPGLARPNDAGAMIADISIGKNVVAADIVEPLKVSVLPQLRFHFVGLSDDKLSWCLEVVKKLLILRFLNGSGELWLHECTLSKASIEELVSKVKTTCKLTFVRLQHRELTGAEQQHLLSYSLKQSVVLNFSIPRFDGV